jgi:hypothetical protein
MKKYLTFFLLIILHTGLKAQQIEWNPASKIERGAFQYYIGQDSSGVYTIISNNDLKNDILKSQYHTPGINISPDQKIALVKFDQSLNVMGIVDLNFHYQMNGFLTGLINNGRMYLVYLGTHNNLKGCYADVFERGGKYIETKTISQQKNAADKEYYCVLYPSRNSAYMLMREPHAISLLDNTFATVWRKENTLKEIQRASLQDQGTVIAYEVEQGGKVFIRRYEIDGKSSEIAIAAEDRGEMRVDTMKNRAYLVSLTGDRNGKAERLITFNRPSIKSDFYANGFRLAEYDLQSMKKIAAHDISFSMEMISATAHCNKMCSARGAADLRLMHVFTTSSGDPIVVFEQFYAEAVKDNSTTQYYYGNIISQRIDREGKVTEQFVPRDVTIPSYQDVMAHPTILFHKDKLYVLANDMKGNIQKYCYSSSLQKLQENAQNTEKEKHVTLDTKYPIPLKPDKYLLFGRNNKRVISAFLSL